MKKRLLALLAALCLLAGCGAGPAARTGPTVQVVLEKSEAFTATAPVYSGTYFDTLADKYDRLCALRGQRKLVLFSGSSTRFGYDSAVLDAALPDGTKSYNAYGDYIFYRPDAATDAPVYGLPVDYTPAAYPKAQYIDPLNAVYAAFLQKGITVYFTYAPRNAQALSPESTPEARAALDAYFRRELIVPVISPLEESLYPGRYLYGTDNHLSTAGVALRTARILDDLAGQGVAVLL